MVGDVPVRLADVIETAVYRIVQEALRNICIRHTDTVRISVGASANLIYCSVRYDGAAADAHLDLPAAEQRTETLGGMLLIGPGAEGGTELIVVIPLI